MDDGRDFYRLTFYVRGFAEPFIVECVDYKFYTVTETDEAGNERSRQRLEWTRADDWDETLLSINLDDVVASFVWRSPAAKARELREAQEEGDTLDLSGVGEVRPARNLSAT